MDMEEEKRDEMPVVEEKGKLRLKNWIIMGFVVEHLVVGLFLGVATLRVVRAYTEIGFGDLDTKAREFVPGDKERLVKSLTGQVVAQAAKWLFTGGTAKAEFVLTEADINNQLNSPQLSEYLDRSYMALGAGNEMRIWVGVKELEQPIMIRVGFSYLPDSGFDVELKNLNLGPVPLPVRWFDFAERTVEETLNEAVTGVHNSGQAKLQRVWTDDGQLRFEVEVLEPERLLNSAGWMPKLQ